MILLSVSTTLERFTKPRPLLVRQTHEPPQWLATVRVLRRPVIRPDVQLLRLAIVAEGGDG